MRAGDRVTVSAKPRETYSTSNPGDYANMQGKLEEKRKWGSWVRIDKLDKRVYLSNLDLTVVGKNPKKRALIIPEGDELAPYKQKCLELLTLLEYPVSYSMLRDEAVSDHYRLKAALAALEEEGRIKVIMDRNRKKYQAIIKKT